MYRTLLIVRNSFSLYSSDLGAEEDSEASAGLEWGEEDSRMAIDPQEKAICDLKEMILGEEKGEERSLLQSSSMQRVLLIVQSMTVKMHLSNENWRPQRNY